MSPQPVQPGLPAEDEPTPSAESWLSRPLPFFGLVAFLIVATLGALVILPALAPVPMVVLAVLWLIWKVPLRYPAYAMFALALWVDCFPERPYELKWKSPLFFLGRLFYDKLNNFKAGIPFPLVDLLLFLLLGIMVWRNAHRQRIDPPTVPLPRPLVALLGLTLVTIVWVEVWGMSRGGIFRVSQWQFHQILLLPLMVALFNAVVRGPEDYRLIGKIIIAGCFIKAFLGAFFIVAVARPGAMAPEYATTHSDTILYVAGLMIAIGRFMEGPSRKQFWKSLLIVSVIFMGMHYNDRRLAYVSFFMALTTAFLISPWHSSKRGVARVLVVLSPLLPLYFAIGWQNPVGVFAPLRPFKSVIEGEVAEEGGMDYRDMENFNVIMTWKNNPVLGTGYGHPFDEVMQLPDISKVFEDYLYHPHNSLLGICAFGGVVGLTGLWLYIAAVVYLGVRAYHRSHPPEERTAMLVSLGVVAAYINQCFGDMGVISWVGTFLMAMAVTVAGKQAIVAKAWPDPREASGRRPAAQEPTGAITT